eukprot:6193453-Pleurochrysis_carterae.AAC.6
MSGRLDCEGAGLTHRVGVRISIGSIHQIGPQGPRSGRHPVFSLGHETARIEAVGARWGVGANSLQLRRLTHSLQRGASAGPESRAVHGRGAGSDCVENYLAADRNLI